VPTTKITKRSVDALRPTAKDFFVWDTELKRFGLKMTPKGAKSYVVQYRMGGREAKTQRYTIGKHGSPWTPDSARMEADRLLKLADMGISPVQADRERRREVVDLAFDTYADRFVDVYLKSNWKAWEDGERNLALHVKPALRGLALPQIKRTDLTPIFDKLKDRPSAQHATFAVLRKLFNWALDRGDLTRVLPTGEEVKVSPLYGMKPPKGSKKRQRVLSDEELIAVWQASFKLGHLYGPPTRALVLSGLRLQDVSAAEWREFDRDAGRWIIPESRTKNGLPHLVPITVELAQVLDDRSELQSEYVFSKNGKRPPGGWSSAKKRLDALMLELMKERAAERGENPDCVKLTPWRLHDLRRTFSTSMAKLGIPTEVIEACLNHISGTKGGVAGVYNVYQYAPEKAEALRAWETHVRSLVSEASVSNVIALATRRA